jgi:hypothetical protein
LFGYQVLAALYEFFPLRPSAINDLAAALHVFADLLLALIHQVAHLFGGLPGAGTQVFGSLPGASDQVLGAYKIPTSAPTPNPAKNHARPLTLLSSAMMKTLLLLSLKMA